MQIQPSFMDKLVAKFFNYSCKGLNLANLPIPVVVILIRIRKFVPVPMDLVSNPYPWHLTCRTRTRRPTLYPFPCHCTHTCTHGLRHRCIQDHNYSTNKVSKKTVIVPHFFVCLFLVLDAGENFWNLDKKIDGGIFWFIKKKIDTVFSPFT